LSVLAGLRGKKYEKSSCTARKELFVILQFSKRGREKGLDEEEGRRRRQRQGETALVPVFFDSHYTRALLGDY